MTDNATATKSVSENVVGLATALGAFAITIFATVYQGFILAWGWNAFVVAALGAPHVSIPMALGLAGLMRLVVKPINFDNIQQKSMGDSMIDTFRHIGALTAGWGILVLIWQFV